MNGPQHPLQESLNALHTEPGHQVSSHQHHCRRHHHHHHCHLLLLLNPPLVLEPDSGFDRFNYALPFAPVYGSVCPTQFEDSQHKICVRGCHHQPQPPSQSIRIPLFDNLFKTCTTWVALQAVTLLLAQIFSSLTHTHTHTSARAFALDRTMPSTRWAYQPYSKFQIYSNSVYGGKRNKGKTAANTSSTCCTMGKFYLWHAISLWILLPFWIFASQLGRRSIKLSQLSTSTTCTKF